MIKETFHKVQDKQKLILHCHGLPGSGKSQLVRMLAKRFPYSVETAVKHKSNIKWHVQCGETDHNLIKEFWRLAKKLSENCLTNPHIVWESIEQDLKRNQSMLFVEMLLNCNVPILIIFEDPVDNDRELLRNFFQILDSSFQDLNHSKFHVYVTSRKKWPIISNNDCLGLGCYEVSLVKGFTLNESIEFLRKGFVDKGERTATSSSDQTLGRERLAIFTDKVPRKIEKSEDTSTQAEEREKTLIKVFHRFSGMPLGLLSARCFCRFSNLSYKEYLELVEDCKYDILSSEKEAILDEYGRSGEHIFQAIALLFFPDSDDTEPLADLNLDAKILCCVSYFHFNCIPRFLLEHCCNVVRKKKNKRCISFHSKQSRCWQVYFQACKSKFKHGGNCGKKHIFARSCFTCYETNFPLG